MKDKSDRKDNKDYTAKPQINQRRAAAQGFWGRTNSLTPFFPLCALCAFAVSSFIFWNPIILAQDDILSLITERQTALNDAELYSETHTEETLTPARQRTEMEIRTSTLSELALWCRTLGLSESGTRADLSQRLRRYFNLPAPVQNEDRRIITIESTQVSEYFTIDVIDEDYARLTGNVSLRLIDDNTIHTIRADEILFNRTRNILTARGNVVYEKNDNESTETFRGENITVNLDNWSSILLDGSSARGLDSGGTSYLFSGSVISQSDDNVTVLSKATITNAANEEALWSITASRLWLLPGSDFAILNAVLKVGEIPVLYIPFFYYPGDQIFFHPVIGYRSREGGFVQTTTYILGQPRSDPNNTNSISRILGNSNNTERELEGLFLRSTGIKVTDTKSISLKVLVDYYVNLGAYLGLDLAVPKTGILNPLVFSAGLGFTRTVSNRNGNYTPYDDEGSFDWNHSSLFSLSVPFRYRMNFNSSISGRYGSLFWNIPFFSDPFAESDFLNRSEDMDWVNMLLQGASLNEENSTRNEIRLYQWHVNGNLNFTPSAVSPYISRISLSNISTTLSFRVKDDLVSQNNADSPQRYFFAPDKYTIYNISGSISGTPLTYPSASRAANTQNIREDDPLNGIGTPVSPWAQTPSGDNTQTRSSNQSDILSPPALAQTFNLPRTGNTAYTIDYQISPASSTELQFFTNNWKSYDLVDWKDTQSILTSIGGNSNVNFRINHTTGLYTNIITLFANGTWRDYGFLNEDAFLTSSGLVDENRMKEARRQQYSQTNYSTSYAYNGTVRPLMENSIFSQSYLQYNLRGTLVRSKRYSGADGPELTPQWGSWVKEERRGSEDIAGLTGNRFSANLSANIMDNNQTISVSADLPPLDWAIITSAAFRYWISETSINFGFERPSPEKNTQSQEKDNDWIFLPVYFTQIFRFPSIGSFTYNMVLKPEEDNDITGITASLTLWNFRASFTAEKMRKYTFTPVTDSQSGSWVQNGDPVLVPSQLSLFFTDRREFPNNRISYSFDISTSLAFDLQRYTNSNFQLTLGLRFNVPGLLELRLSATTHNTVIWRYFKAFSGLDDLTFMYPSGPQNNIFIDLIDSINFFNEDKRRRSGFKIQRFNFSAIHFLGDWQAELGITMYPHQVNNQRYRIATDISFLVQWKPITEIKADIGYDGRNERWTFK
ncbi:MAG: LPS-assembly protein LptD [Treponema sp.]|nr:LPS-assembly protein LptD [Treponema sp.]